MAMHKAEQERLTRTTDAQNTEMVGEESEIIDEDMRISSENDEPTDEIRNFWFQNSRKFSF